MGIVVDLAQSKVDIESDPGILNKLAPAPDVIAKRVRCAMMSFQARFAFRFDPRLGYPAKNKPGACRIGIVQNVLYASLVVAYDDGLKTKLSYSQHLIDCGDQMAFPFYNTSGSVSRRSADGQSESVKNIYPYRDILHNTKGFGELLDPYKPADDNIVLQQSSSVSLVDQPFFAVKLRKANNALLTEVTHIITFGMWLVALTADATKPAHVLAHADPFSLLYTSKFSTRGKLLSIGTPDADFKVAAKKGTAHSEHDFKSSRGVGIRSGAGSIQPVLKGITVQAKDKQWEDTLLSM
jgi:hypothetical protein